MKKTTLFILALVATTITTQVTAQDSLFDLKSYKTTNYERSSLDLNFDMNEFFNVLNRNKNDVNKTSNGNSTMNIETSYLKSIYTRRNISNYELRTTLFSEYKTFQNQIDSIPFSSKTFSMNNNISTEASYSTDRYYSASTENFLKVGGRIYLYLSPKFQWNESFDKYTNRKVEKSTIQENSFYADASFTIGHGHGRMENIEDAVEAIYILDDLAKNKLLTKEYSATDVNKLANKITELKKERFFDERLFRQKTMKELISLLTDYNLIKEHNIDVFNILADYHYYAGIKERQSGKKLEYYLSPHFEYNTTSFNRHPTHDRLFQNYIANIEYLNSKPISLKWQQFYSASINANVSNNANYEYYQIPADSVNKTNSFYYSHQIGAGYSINYYPSTRTSFKLGGRVNYRYSKQKDIYNFHDYSFGIIMEGYYYLSERLRLSGEFNISQSISSNNFTDTNLPKSYQNYLSQKLNFHLTYFLF